MSDVLKVRLSLSDRFRYAVLKLRYDIAQSARKRAVEALHVAAAREYYLSIEARDGRAHKCAIERRAFAQEHFDRAKGQAYYMERIFKANLQAANRSGKMPKPSIR